MKIELNHTIVNATDPRATADFLTEVLGLPEAQDSPPFLNVHLTNAAILSVLEAGRVHPQHYAFLVGESEFDEIFGRIQGRGLPYWADPGRRRPGEINTNDGGRGVYWEDPSGHFLEIITRPYGSGG